MESQKAWSLSTSKQLETAIDSLRYMGDVGDTDMGILKEILPHCTAEQLMHIENSSKGRDLSSVTDSLWKRFYEKHFGEDSLKLVLHEKAKLQDGNAGLVFKWKQVYEAKVRATEVAQQKSLELLKKRYAEERAKKQSRQIKLYSETPQSNCCKRGFSGTTAASCSGTKGNLMKKARTEFLKSNELRVRQVMKKKSCMS